MPIIDGEIVCINHLDQKMEKDEDACIIPLMKKEKDSDKPVVSMSEGFVYSVYSCPECGYNEFYNYVKKLID